MKEKTQTRQLQVGSVVEVLPRGLFAVRLDDGGVVRGGIDSRAKAVMVRLIAGDTVEVRRVARQPRRVQIVRKL